LEIEVRLVTRLPRKDYVGQWHHVMHRGIARRTVFESALDIRAFLALLAQVVRAGELEVHSFCVLTTHFHLLVRCPAGNLGIAMGRVLNGYVRWFNRGRRRDGSLFRGRFRSRPVTLEAYRRVLVRYIDDNPVHAGLVALPREYPHGSASRFCAARATPWLEHGWIASVVADRLDGAVLDARTYSMAFERGNTDRVRRFVDRRFASAPAVDDPLDALLAAAPPRVLDWMRRKADLADGTSVGVPVCEVEDVAHAVAEARRLHGAWSIRQGNTRGRTADAWLQIENGLARDLCAATCEENGERLKRTGTWSSNAHRRHRRMLAVDGRYAEACAGIASRALAVGNA
jgi:REP element-mobilizing transposase RayT